MPKFKVKTNEILYYEEIEITANSKEQAIGIYLDKIAGGDVEVCKNSYCDITAN